MPVAVQRTGDDVAVLTFSAPPVNLYSAALHDEFDVALGELASAPPRALIIRAEGRVVSGGVDVSLFAEQRSQESTKVLYDRMLELPNRVAGLNYPTVFAAHALTLTWAFEVAVACDIILAAPKAKFGLVERVIGLTPTMGGTQRLAARAGVGRAKEFVFTGEIYDAGTLERWNVVNRILSAGEFDAEVLAFTAKLAAGPTRAFGAAKDILRHFEAGGVAEALDHTTEIAAALFETEDLHGGMKSFLEDGPGKATFQGR
ncbi:MAG: enoyl-CoA hydratase/isomerase family protein [Aeromicrobium sp.]